MLLLGAVGQLQFEVVAHRLEHEYGVKARIQPSALPGRALGHLRRRRRRRTRAASASSTPTRTASPTTRSTRRRCWSSTRPSCARSRPTGRRSSSTRCASTRGWCSRSSSRAEAPASTGRRRRSHPTSRPRHRAWVVGRLAVAAARRASSQPRWRPCLRSPDARARSARAPTRRGRSRPAGRRRGTGRSSGASSAGAPAARRGRPAAAARRRAAARSMHRLGATERRRRHVADVDAAVDAGLVDADGDAGLGRRRADGAGGEDERENGLHGSLLVRGSGGNARRRCRARTSAASTRRLCPPSHGIVATAIAAGELSMDVTAPPRPQPPRALPRPDPLGPPRRHAAAALADAVGAVDRRRRLSAAGTCWSSSRSAPS